VGLVKLLNYNKLYNLIYIYELKQSSFSHAWGNKTFSDSIVNHFLHRLFEAVADSPATPKPQNSYTHPRDPIQISSFIYFMAKCVKK